MSSRLFLALFLIAICFATAGAAEPSVGVLWYKKSGMAQRVLKGFVERLREVAPDLPVEVKMDLPDADAAAPHYERFQKEKSAIVFLRSDGAKYLAAHPPAVPAFIGAANNPVALGVVPSLEAPGGMISGVTYYVPVARQFELYRQLWPELSSVGLLVMEGHPSSAVEQAETRAVCEELGIDYREAVCASKKDLAQAIKGLTGAAPVDLLIMGNQNLLIDNGALVAALARSIPVMSYSEKPVAQKHAAGGLVVNDHKLGRLLADSVHQVVVEGAEVGTVPVKTDPAPRILLAKGRIEALGLTVPDGLEVEWIE